MKKGKQSKREAPHTVEAMAAGKELMVTALAKGMGPGDAAEMLGLGRSTVYKWKGEDVEFSMNSPPFSADHGGALTSPRCDLNVTPQQKFSFPARLVIKETAE